MAKIRIIFLLLHVAFGLSCSKNVPKEAHGVVFESVRFTAPLSLVLPMDLSSDQEHWYRNALAQRGFLPPLPPVGQFNRQIPNPDLRDTLSSLGFVQIIALPDSTTGKPLKYFRYSDKVSLLDGQRMVQLAHRNLTSIEYKNRYKINPAGLGETDVCAITFSYRFISLLPSLESLDDQFKAEAKVVQNLDTGKWDLDILNLQDPDPTEYLLKSAQSILVKYRQQPRSEEPIDSADSGESDERKNFREKYSRLKDEKK